MLARRLFMKAVICRWFRSTYPDNTPQMRSFYTPPDVSFEAPVKALSLRVREGTSQMEPYTLYRSGAGSALAMRGRGGFRVATGSVGALGAKHPPRTWSAIRGGTMGLDNRGLLVGIAAVAAVASGCGDGGTDTTQTDGTVTKRGADVRVLADCKKAELQPASIVVTCADAGFALEDLEWSSWGGKAAIGQGTAAVNDCKPDCASGEVKDYDASVELSDIQDCPGFQQYGSVTVDFTGEGPKGFEDPFEQQLGCGPSGEEG
jgi:hypothetical protein